MTRPRCLYCGGLIPKEQSILYIRDEAQKERGIGSSDWLTLPELPKTKEEVQRLTNWTVRSVDSFAGQGGIFRAVGWDGESYSPRHGYFCKVDCAARFGRIMAERGARR
jgi:hypothetical protein